MGRGAWAGYTFFIVVWRVRDILGWVCGALINGHRLNHARGIGWHRLSLKALAFIASVFVSGCSQMSPVAPHDSKPDIVIKSVLPVLTPSAVPVPTPSPTKLEPQDIRFRANRSMTTLRRKCWYQGSQYRSACGVVYLVTIEFNAKTAGAVLVTWDAKLSTYDSCCGDRTLNTYFRQMNAPNVLNGKVDLTRVSEWDGYYMENSPSIPNYRIPTGLTDGIFAHLTFSKGARATVDFSIAFDNGGGGYMSWPYPLKFRVFGNGNLLASFTQDAKD